MRLKTLGIREQSAWVRICYPAFRCSITDGLLICRGTLQPGPVSRVYKAEIHYRVGKWPKAFVPGNQLEPLLPKGKIPHTYCPTQPCLFYPSSSSWRSDMKLSHTVIPWLALWLAFYEMWRVTGEWYGGGITHGESNLIEPAA